MTPAEIRVLVDEMAPRARPNGSINAQHVAIEQTLRRRHGHPSYIDELDGPGKFLPRPVLDGSTEHYGHRVADLGEDSDSWIVTGHPAPRRALAAVLRYLRVDCGLDHRDLEGFQAARITARGVIPLADLGVPPERIDEDMPWVWVDTWSHDPRAHRVTTVEV